MKLTVIGPTSNSTYSYAKQLCFVMFVTAVCVLFQLKLYIHSHNITGSAHIRFRIRMKDQITFIARVLWRPLWAVNCAVCQCEVWNRDHGSLGLANFSVPDLALADRAIYRARVF